MNGGIAFYWGYWIASGVVSDIYTKRLGRMLYTREESLALRSDQSRLRAGQVAGRSRKGELIRVISSASRRHESLEVTESICTGIDRRSSWT